MLKNKSTDTFYENQSVHKVDENGNTLLYQALLKDDIHVDNLLEILINTKADVNARNNYGQTALHLVASRSTYVSKPIKAFTHQSAEKLVRLLIEKGALVNAQDNYGNTALHLAVEGGKYHLLNYHTSQFSHFQTSSLLSDPDVVAARSFIQKENLSTIEILSKVCDLNIRNLLVKTALHIAAECGKAEAIKMLLEAGADVDAKDNEGNTALHSTLITKRYVDKFILTAMLDRGVDVNIKNIRGETPMHLLIDCCVRDAHSIGKDDFKVLLACGVDVNLQDEKGETCLIRAVRKKLHPVDVEYIIRHKTVLNLTDNKGNSALHYAALSKSQPIMRILIRAGADSNLQNNDGKTPLHLLFQLHDRFNIYDIKDLIELSLSHGLDVNLQDKNGDTLLHLATRSYWRDELLNVLLVKGARINVENHQGVSVADLYLDNLYETCSDVDITKLTEAGIKYYMTSGIKTVVFDTLRSEFFKTSCLKELAQMKQTKIGNVFSRYYDPVYVADVELEQLVAFENVIDQFPIYGILLIVTYVKAKRRNRLLDVLSCNFDISGNCGTHLTLVSEMKRNILSYLSDKDLSNLFKAIGLQKAKSYFHDD